MGTNWIAVRDGGFAVPPGRPHEELVAELLELLASPHPGERDDVALPVLATWVEGGVLDPLLEELGHRLVVALRHPQVQARTFAVLGLGEVVGRAAVAPGRPVGRGVVRAWLEETIRWYATEEDLRPWDAALGWLHAPAHGADALGVFALWPGLAVGDVARVADALLGRLLDPSTPLFADGEEARIAQAVFAAAACAELERATVEGWFGRVRAAVDAGTRQTERTPAWLSNTVRAMQMLHVLVGGSGTLAPGGEPVRIVHADVVAAGVVRALAPWWPFLRP